MEKDQSGFVGYFMNKKVLEDAIQKSTTKTLKVVIQWYDITIMSFLTNEARKKINYYFFWINLIVAFIVAYAQ